MDLFSLWSVGNGASILVLNHRWIGPDCKLLNYAHQVSGDVLNQNVHDLVDADGNWCTDLISSFIPSSFVKRIHALLPLVHIVVTIACLGQEIVVVTFLWLVV